LAKTSRISTRKEKIPKKNPNSLSKNSKNSPEKRITGYKVLLIPVDKETNFGAFKVKATQCRICSFSK
jgi:hypothetical protein